MLKNIYLLNIKYFFWNLYAMFWMMKELSDIRELKVSNFSCPQTILCICKGGFKVGFGSGKKDGLQEQQSCYLFDGHPALVD